MGLESRRVLATAALSGAVQALPASDFVAAAVTLAGALGTLQFFDELAKRDLLEKVRLLVFDPHFFFVNSATVELDQVCFSS